MRISVPNRVLLLLTGLLAAYQIAAGTEGATAATTLSHTVAFGVLLVAGLLLMILGYDVLESPLVVIISTIIPLSLATGLAWQHLGSFRVWYLLFAVAGFLAVAFTRLISLPAKSATLVLAVVHGIAGMTIFLLPVVLSVQGRMHPLFSLVGVGGTLIGVGGLLLSFLRAGRPILSRETILKVLPGLLLLTTLSFVTGFGFA